MRQRFTAAWGWFFGAVASLASGLWAGFRAHGAIEAASAIDVDARLRDDQHSPSGCGCQVCGALMAQGAGTAFGYGLYVFAALALAFGIFALVRFFRSVEREQ